MRNTNNLKQSIDLCVVIPVHNEKNCLIAVVDELRTTLSFIQQLKQVVLIIVDDFSQDNGIELLKQWFCKQHLHNLSLTIVRLQHRHGVGNALFKGFKLAETYLPHLTLVMDADGQHDPSCIAELIDKTGSADIVCTLRGKKGDSLFFCLCYKIFHNFIKYNTSENSQTSNFCMIKLPVLEYLVKANYIDYLGAFLNNAPFSCTKLPIERRTRIAGNSKLGFFGHAYTAAVIISYYPRLLSNLDHVITLSLIMLGTIAITTTANTAVIIVAALLAILSQLWYQLQTKILFRRSFPNRLVTEDLVEQLE